MRLSQDFFWRIDFLASPGAERAAPCKLDGAYQSAHDAMVVEFKFRPSPRDDVDGPHEGSS